MNVDASEVISGVANGIVNNGDGALSELAKTLPLGVFFILCLATIVIMHFVGLHNIGKMYDKSIGEVRKAYKDARSIFLAGHSSTQDTKSVSGDSASTSAMKKKGNKA